ncbi:MAG: BON domain-containing protein [Burkholderiales bacterium]
MRIFVFSMALILPMLQGCFPLVAGGAAAGVGGAVLVAEDRRTVGSITEDQEIEFKARARVAEQVKEPTHISVTSYNRTVLLTGQAPSEEIKKQVEALVADMSNVRAIENDIQIAAPSSLTSRANDSYLTSKVKARMLDAKQFQANHVKVVTENNVVYLLGLVTRKEAEAATEIARTTEGVQKVVKVFEYVTL